MLKVLGIEILAMVANLLLLGFWSKIHTVFGTKPHNVSLNCIDCPCMVTQMQYRAPLCCIRFGTSIASDLSYKDHQNYCDDDVNIVNLEAFPHWFQ